MSAPVCEVKDAAVLSLTQAAARLGVSEKTAGRYVAAGKLAERRNPLNNRLYFLAQEIDAVRAGGSATGTDPAAR